MPPAPKAPQKVTNEELRGLLGLPEEIYDLGFKQTRYNPCELGIQPLQAGRCGPEYYSTISLQMLCRTTKGTIQEAATEQALYDNNLRWRAGGLAGRIQLDEDGFGIIVMRSKFPKGRVKIRLISGNDFLYMNVSDLKKVVVPANWCG